MRPIAALLMLPCLACGAQPPADLPPAGDVPRFACRETTFEPNDEVRGVWGYTLDKATRERDGLHAPGVGPRVDMEQRERFDDAWRTQRRTLDFSADGRVDHVEETRYDAGGRPILATVAYDDSGIAAWSTMFTYDNDGHLIVMEETSRAGDRVVRAFTNDADPRRRRHEQPRSP